MHRRWTFCGLLGASAAVSFIAAPLLVREKEAGPPVSTRLDAPLEKRFPEQTAAWRRPAREDARWHEAIGHAFSLKERDETEDPRWDRLFAGLRKVRPWPAGCPGCHASVADARQSIGCLDCHDGKTLELRVTRPEFAAALSLPGRPSHQDMRTYVCAQCHSEYFLEGAGLKVSHAWAKGLKAEEIEAQYDAAGVSDWTHAETGAALIRVRHPQFEMWRQGIHARNGVACSDCHMEPLRRGAARIRNHHVASPLGRVAQSCARCHAVSETEMNARVTELRARYADLETRAVDAITGLLDEAYAARERGAADSELHDVRMWQRKAMLRLGFAADGSRGFHAPSEAARLLAEAIDCARRGQLAAARIRGGL